MQRCDVTWLICVRDTTAFHKYGMSDLEVRAGDTGCDLFEERLLHPDELRRLDHVQDLLDLPEEHHLDTRDNTHIRGYSSEDRQAPPTSTSCTSAVSPLSACRFLASTWAALWWSGEKIWSPLKPINTAANHSAGWMAGIHLYRRHVLIIIPLAVRLSLHRCTYLQDGD